MRVILCFNFCKISIHSVQRISSYLATGLVYYMKTRNCSSLHPGTTFAGFTAFNILSFNIGILLTGGISALQETLKSLRRIEKVLKMEEKPDSYVRMDPVDGKLEHLP